MGPAHQPVWDLVDGFMQYDSMALFACVPALRSYFYEPVEVFTNAADGIVTANLVIGYQEAAAASTNHKQKPVPPPAVSGLKEEKKSELLNLLHDGFEIGLTLNHHFKAQVVLVAEVREDTLVDLCLTIVMLRTLFEVEIVHCLGVVLLCTDSKAVEPPECVRNTLDEVGLRFVP